MRFEVPANRQAYDRDLRDFETKLKSLVKELQAHALAHPGDKTDILGSVALAEQELHLYQDDAKITLVILSDFIQEDSAVDFRTTKKVSDVSAAVDFARREFIDRPIQFKRVKLYLGILQSAEYASMSRQRRRAIKAFWLHYFEAAGVGARFSSDGPGMLRSAQ